MSDCAGGCVRRESYCTRRIGCRDYSAASLDIVGLDSSCSARRLAGRKSLEQDMSLSTQIASESLCATRSVSIGSYIEGVPVFQVSGSSKAERVPLNNQA